MNVKKKLSLKSQKTIFYFIYLFWPGIQMPWATCAFSKHKSVPRRQPCLPKDAGPFWRFLLLREAWNGAGLSCRFLASNRWGPWEARLSSCPRACCLPRGAWCWSHQSWSLTPLQQVGRAQRPLVSTLRPGGLFVGRILDKKNNGHYHHIGKEKRDRCIDRFFSIPKFLHDWQVGQYRPLLSTKVNLATDFTIASSRWQVDDMTQLWKRWRCWFRWAAEGDSGSIKKHLPIEHNLFVFNIICGALRNVYHVKFE